MAQLNGRLSPASAGLSGELSPTSAGLQGTLATGWSLETITIVPSAETQTITASAGHDGFSSVTVSPIPQNYGLISWNGVTLTVS